MSSDDQLSRDNNQPDEISDIILKRCGGIPLSIIRMASLLVGKPRDKWSELYKNICFGRKERNQKILLRLYCPLATLTCLHT